MEMNHCLPFIVGQEAESKSFVAGFRGAWFRCKIKDIRSIKGCVSYALEFFDFPDEKIRWTKLYQNPIGKVTREERKMHLMVRPSFPPIFHESQVPDICGISEVVAIVDDVWKVGDLVDWWTDGCYWSGIIIHLLGEDKVKIKLPEPPVGEGSYYEASCKDLRPSLDWSPVHGWTVPISTENETAHHCARLLQPNSQVEEKNDHYAKGEAPREIGAASVCSHGSSDSLQSSVKQMPKRPSDAEPTAKGEAPCENVAASVCSHDSSDSSSADSEPNKEEPAASVSSHGTSEPSPSSAKQIPNEPSDTEPNKEVQALCEEPAASVSSPGSSDSSQFSAEQMPKQHSDTEPNKEVPDLCDDAAASVSSYGSSGSLPVMNTLFSDTLESSILDLEELTNKIKWLKRVQQFGLESANSMVPSWTFLEERVSLPHRE